MSSRNVNTPLRGRAPRNEPCPTNPTVQKNCATDLESAPKSAPGLRVRRQVAGVQCRQLDTEWEVSKRKCWEALTSVPEALLLALFPSLSQILSVDVVVSLGALKDAHERRCHVGNTTAHWLTVSESWLPLTFHSFLPLEGPAVAASSAFTAGVCSAVSELMMLNFPAGSSGPQLRNDVRHAWSLRLGVWYLSHCTRSSRTTSKPRPLSPLKKKYASSGEGRFKIKRSSKALGMSYRLSK